MTSTLAASPLLQLYLFHQKAKHCIQACALETLLELKRKIQEATSVPIERQKLVFPGCNPFCQLFAIIVAKKFRLNNGRLAFFILLCR